MQGTSTAQDPKFTSKRNKEMLAKIAKSAPKEFGVKVRCYLLGGWRRALAPVTVCVRALVVDAHRLTFAR